MIVKFGKSTEINDRRYKVSQLYLSGIIQSEIAEQLNVNQSTVSRDLEAIRQAWLDASLRNFDEARAEELAKIDEQERKYQAKVIELENIADKLLTVSEHEKAARVIGTLHKFMNSVDDCIKQRCELLGLNAPQRLEHSGNVQFDMDSWLQQREKRLNEVQ